MKIVNKKYNLDNKLHKKIVLISDIHYYSKKDIKRLNNVLDNIKDINPDYICITGDITDKSNISDFDLLIEWLEKLSNICKVIVTLGNHEYYVNKRKGIYKLNNININKIKKIHNLYFLDNKNVILDGINFIGLVLPIEHYQFNKEEESEFEENIKNIKTDNKCYNILLCHSPENISKEKIISKINVDLVLCGHMHGGIVPNFLRFLFGKRGLISPQKRLFPNSVYGNIKLGNKNIIITSGIKILSESHLPFFTSVFSSEIVEINL